MLTVTDSDDNTETISDEDNAIRATPELIEHLFTTASDQYRRSVTHWWLFGRETPVSVDGDYWVWIGN
jgi:hypothetical protein